MAEKVDYGDGGRSGNMIKIKISYEYPAERKYIIDKFGEDVKSIKEPRQNENKYKRIYIKLKEIRRH